MTWEKGIQLWGTLLWRVDSISLPGVAVLGSCVPSQLLDFEVGGGHGAVLGFLRLTVLMPVG